MPHNLIKIYDSKLGLVFSNFAMMDDLNDNEYQSSNKRWIKLPLQDLSHGNKDLKTHALCQSSFASQTRYILAIRNESYRSVQGSSKLAN